MITVYLEISFSTNSYHVEACHLIFFANQLADFYMTRGFTERYFNTEHNSTIMTLMLTAYFLIIYLILLIDEI